jgi:hypothetical protein
MTEIVAHPDARFYLQMQGYVAMSIALALGLLTFLAATRRKIRKGDLVVLIMGAVVSTFLIFEAFWSFTRPTDTITVAADRITVDGNSVTISPDAHVTIAGTVPALPDDSDRGYGRLPGASRFPPFFTGGPMLTVTSRDGSVSFKPVVYGSSGYFVDNANPEADRLLARLAPLAMGEDKAWLVWMSTSRAALRAGAPVQTTSPTFFFAIYIPLSALVIGFLVGVNVLLIRGRRRKAAT